MKNPSVDESACPPRCELMMAMFMVCLTVVKGSGPSTLVLPTCLRFRTILQTLWIALTDVPANSQSRAAQKAR